MDVQTRDIFIESWKRAVEAKDLQAMLGHFGETMRFASPAIFKPATERPYIDRMIGYVDELIEEFHYTEIYPTDDGAVMIFEGKHAGMRLEGIDHFRLHPDGKVAELRVFIRPMNALNALAAQMMKRFQTPAS